jgi:hypothetical protein
VAVVRLVGALHDKLDVDVVLAKDTQDVTRQATSIWGSHDPNLGQVFVADDPSSLDLVFHCSFLL